MSGRGDQPSSRREAIPTQRSVIYRFKYKIALDGSFPYPDCLGPPLRPEGGTSAPLGNKGEGSTEG
eukprot:1248654-Amorphochlora_amoeboformis.AAC.1